MEYKAGSAISQTKDLIGIQLGSSVITFLFNTLIARTVGPEIFGIANVEFYVVYSAAQFLSREYIRKSSIIYSKNKSKNKSSQRALEREIFSFGWCAVCLSFIISFLIYQLFHLKRWYQPTSSESNTYLQGILLCTISGLIEMFAEPFILIANIRVWSRTISAIEAIGLFLKCIFTFIAITVLNQTNYLLSFAIAQVCASSIVLVLWIAMFTRITIHKQNKKHDNVTGFMTYSDLFPTFPTTNSALTSSSVMFFFQQFIKFLLTEGEKIVIISLNIDKDSQGVYALVSNLGSLVARYVFAQIEKTANTEFSKLDVAKDGTVIIDILSNVLKMVFILALICVCFSPNYSFMTLDVLYGEKWSKTDAPNALALYCWYLLFMSVNGVTEAFVQSYTPNKWYQMFLVMVTVIYWIAVAVLMDQGVNGLIYANCLNMVLRIVYNCCFIHQRIALSHVFTIFNSIALFIALMASYLVTRVSNQWYVLDETYATCGGSKIICYGAHAAVAVVCLCFIMMVLWRFEKPFLRNVKRLLLGKQD
eukprot:167642_1